MSFNSGKKIVFVVMAVVVIATLLTGAIMLLWNWLMPELFGVTTITFLQALGALVLSKLLFGGWMHKKHCSHCHHPNSKWGEMSPDAKHSMKAKFMQKWAQCGYEDEVEESTDQTPTEK